MKMKTRVLLVAAASSLLSAAVSAQTYRCDKGVVAGGDSKSSVIQRCGQPQMQETFCEPIAISSQVDATGNTVVNVPQCETVDSWTYHPGSGKFITTLEFRRGKLTRVTEGDRAN